MHKEAPRYKFQMECMNEDMPMRKRRVNAEMMAEELEDLELIVPTCCDNPT